MSALNPPLLPGVALQLVGTVLQGPPGVRGRDGLSAYEVWKMNGNPTGTVADYLLSLKGTTGDNGKNIELQKSADHIQWRLQGDATWINLIPLVDVKGADGTNGRGVVNITRSAGTGIPGTIDTYTITYTDATTSTFNVYNGADGNGDMSKATYDTNNNGKVDTAEVADAVPWAGITDKPTLGTASALNAPAAGNAATNEVVKGDDTRLSDARTPTAHTHGTGDVTGLNTALTALSDHLGAPSNAHPASAIDLAEPTVPSPGSLTAGTVQQRMEEIFDSNYSVTRGLLDHKSEFFIQHSASVIGNTPAGGIAATTVQDAINELDAEKFAKSGGDIAGNINLTGSAQRIRLPFIGTPVGNRTLFQSSSANTSTFIGVIPSGTDRSAGITFSNSSDPDNAGYGYISMSDVNMIITSAIALGTGGTGGIPGAVPLVLTGRSASMRIGDGAVVVTSGTLGYGTGGTVTQGTSKTTTVTLNKPSGRITTHNESLAAGASALFQFVNNTVGIHDTANASVSWGLSNPSFYRVEMFSYGVNSGTLLVKLTNIHTAALAEEVHINFAVIKGAAS